MERDIPFTIVDPDADLSPYRLLVLDDWITADEALAGRLAEHVRGGGSLIVEGEAAQFGTPAGEVLAEVLGIQSLGPTGHEAHYLTGLDEQLARDMGLDDVIVEGPAQRIALTTAQALAYYRYEIAPRRPDMNTLINLPPSAVASADPAISLNRYGQGVALYTACPLATGEIRAHRSMGDDAREYPLQLAANLARRALGQPLLEGTTPAGVEVVVNVAGPADRTAHRHVVHLLNHCVSGQYHDNRPGLLKLADVPVAINEARMGRVTRAFQVADDGEEVSLSVQHGGSRTVRSGEWARVRLPELGAHGMVVFEHDSP
jgi:hypothetical protein